MSTQHFGSGVIKMGTTASPTDAFECQISNFVITSSPNSISIPATYCAGQSTKAQPSSFAVSMTYMQDWGETASLSELLFNNDGSLLYFEFEPTDTTAGTWNGTCWAVAGDIGGEGQGLWVSSEELPCDVKPTYTPAA